MSQNVWLGRAASGLRTVLRGAGFRMQTLDGSPPVRLWRRRLRKVAQPRIWAMIPGFGDSPMSWLPLVSLWIARGAPCDELVLVELPGGFGAKYDALIPTADELLERLAVTLAEIGPEVLIGQSMGGYLAAWLAVHRPPESMKRLVVMCPSGLVLQDRPEGAWTQVLEGVPEGKIDPFLERAVGDMAKNPILRRPVGWFARELGAYLGRSDVHDFLRSFRPGHEMDGRIQKIRVPTLLIWGENDRLVPFFLFAHWKEAFEQNGLPNQFVTVPGAGHGVHVEQPRVVARVIREFVGT